ncbi:MAG: DUF2167 domain-containing protein [Chthoniobacteraceae bacterium]
MKPLIAVIAIAAALFLPARAEDKKPSPQEMAAFQKAMKAIGELQYQSGEVSLAGGKVKITLPPEFQYLDPANARKVLVDIFGNPPQSGSTDGMIVPKGINFLRGGGWEAILKWKDEGYVKDDDFAKIDFNDMLGDLKKSYKAGSDERVKSGYGKMELAAWAQQPHYDRATHKLYYAKLFDVEGPEQQLNYDIRVLGRSGHLELSIMSSKSGMQDIEKQAPAILGMVDFTDGNRYADYKPGTDKVAAYGIAGLIAGGVLAKAGFFKLAWVFAAKFIKLIIVGAIALFAGIKRLVTGSKKTA